MELGVSYIAAFLPDHIKSDMAHLRQIGCTEVLFALQENHLNTLTGALRFGANIAKENGLRPYAVVWGYANTFGGGRMSDILLDDPGLWRVQADGTALPRACLNNPHLIGKFLEIADLCRSHGYEGLFIDEPQVQECYCAHCRERFEQAFGQDLVENRDSPAYRTFQKSTVKDYVSQICRKVKALDRDLKTITCVMPFPPHDELFEPVATIPELDVFGTDPYWLLSGAVGFDMSLESSVDSARKVKALCKREGKSSQIWLNCWRIPAGLEPDIYTGGKALAQVGCDSLYSWSFRGGLGTYETCDDPQPAWSSVVKLYRELSKA